MELNKSSRYLFLVESPEKAKHITQIFKDAGYKNIIVQATKGHFMKLKIGGGLYNTGISKDNDYQIPYVLDDSNSKKYHDTLKLKDQVKAADFIIVASDPDREGEAIAQECIDYFKIPKKKYARVTYQAVNFQAISEGIKNSRYIDENLVKAARARLAVDAIYGFGISEDLRRGVGAKSGGRVQSPTLRRLVEREKEILNFKPEKFIDLYLTFKKNNVDFKAKYQGTDTEDVKKLTEIKQVDMIWADCVNNPFYIESVEHKDRLENPKPPFSTSTFQQEVSSKLGLTAKQASDVAQNLFDSGKISYHRTDAQYFDKEFEDILLEYVKSNFAKPYQSGKVVRGKTEKNSQEGHEALHVLDLNLTPEKYAKEAPSDLNAKVYRIIYNRTVAAALKPAIIAQTTYNIKNAQHRFVMNSNELKFDGYRCVYAYKDEDSSDGEIVKETFAKNEILQNCGFDPQQKETTPPKRYTEPSTLKQMEDDGSGRPSTRPGVIETLKDPSRNYTTVEGKFLKPTDHGIKTIEYLEKNYPDLVDYKYTASVEDNLDDIAHGKKDYVEFMDEFCKKLDESITKASGVSAAASGATKICPKCGKPMKIRKGKYGNFWGCTGYPDCRTIEAIKKKA